MGRRPSGDHSAPGSWLLAPGSWLLAPGSWLLALISEPVLLQLLNSCL
jgi:hypothetical protein